MSKTQLKQLPPTMDNIANDLENSQVHPLEWVAYFLRRIDEHLGQIATTLERDDGGEKLRHQLQSIDQAIRIQGIESKLATRQLHAK